MTAIKKIEQHLDALEADDPYFEEAMNLAQARREGKELAPRKKKRRPK